MIGRLGIVSVVLVVLAPVAVARPFKEQLSKAQLAAAVTSVQDALELDEEAAKKCMTLPTESVDDKATLASCLRGAGALGATVAVWKAVLQDQRSGPRHDDAIRALGPTYEAAGLFSEAARSYIDYAKTLPGESDASERLLRGFCMYRQLGDAKAANAAYKLATKAFKVKTKADAVCDQLRPIVVVVPATP